MICHWKTAVFVACCVAGACVGSPVTAQEPAVEAAPNDRQLFDQPSRSIQRSEVKPTILPAATSPIPSAAVLRQQRAWQRYMARQASIDAALAAGYHPSRPPAPTTPSTTSRYPRPRIIYIPVYYGVPLR